MIRKRIAAAMGAVAAAAAVPLILFAGPAQANPTTPYMCPWSIVDDTGTARWIHSWVQGYGQIICHYNATATISCRWNAYNGDPWWGSPNPSYCPPRAIPTTP
ncbi:hypothetical protein [Herbidospora yilanensis]|uniref:hypothetical protein n=1 Tax=Herbidospora yilanensis TaxID=354426 RepID=UPI000783CA11|nr:hypothetical protein [Herbidospora yilanensis]